MTFVRALERADWAAVEDIHREGIALGFREVGRRERIARAHVGPCAGQWRDTGLIERRSAMNGRG